MKTFLFLVFFASRASAFFSESLWTNPPAIYTNQIGFEFIKSVTDRTAAVGDSWYFTKQIVIGGETNTVTNVLGGVFYGAVTSSVPFNAADADTVTRQMERIMNRFVLPQYAEGGDHSFNSWFTNWLDRWPGSEYAKEDLFDKLGASVGAIIEVSDNPEYQAGGVTGCHRNIYGEVTEWPIYGPASNIVGTLTPMASWVKRVNRIDPLCVARWRVNQSNNFYSGAINEFSLSNSLLIGLVQTQFPFFVISPGDTNAYQPNSITMQIGAEQSQSSMSFWESNRLSVSVSPYSELSNIIMPLSTLTQQAPRAWVDIDAPIMAAGSTNLSNYVVSLQFLERVNTFEGQKIWDSTLLPEQLKSHFIAATNLFLTSYTNWVWTNSLVHSYDQTNFIESYYFATNAAGEYISSNAYLPEVVVDFWKGGCPIFPPVLFPESLGDVVGVETNIDLVPAFYSELDISLSFAQHYYATAEYDPIPCGGQITNEVAWGWEASQTHEAYGSFGGEAISSQILITGLYTGALHRAHVYLDFFDDLYGNFTPRKREYLSEWTYEPQILTGRINPAEYIEYDPAGAITVPCDEEAFMQAQVCNSNCSIIIETRYEPCSNRIEHIAFSLESITNEYYVTLTNPCDAAETFVVTNRMIESSPIYTNDVQEESIDIPWTWGSNTCSGVTSSSWNEVSFTNVIVTNYNWSAGPNTSIVYEIVVDQYCEDTRTNLTVTNITEGISCVSTYSISVPDTTIVTVNRSISQMGNYNYPRAGDHWGWLDVGPYDAYSIRFPYPVYLDNFGLNVDWYGAEIYPGGQIDEYAQMLYCSIHDTYHTTGALGQIYAPNTDYFGGGIYLHIFGRDEIDLDFASGPLIFDIEPGESWSTTAIGSASLTSGITSSMHSKNSVNAKVLIEWQY